ncbi:MAG TPA: arginine--tRNA ligase [Candidatus Methylacidiphilales bacterium]|nr:arginine--tRNA ligase [Candidatus Methylacidiphilales bacterium]
MNTPRQELEARVEQAVTKLFSPAPPGPYVRPCPDPRHGNFQTNVALVQAREAVANPRELATQLVETLEWGDVTKLPGIAEPGFINFNLKDEYVAYQLTRRWVDERLGLSAAEKPETIVIDYSAPNIAKELHVGHLRSTILGDALARIYCFLGHNVIADNHIGDWGTGFGMILFGYKREGHAEKLKQDPFGHLETIYRKVQEEAKADASIREAAKRELVLLQQGDPQNRELWEEFRQYSLEALEVTYQRLGVQFDHTLGESFYNDLLPGVVNDLVKRGIARESEGAIAIFSEGKLPPKNDPFLVSDKNSASGFRDNPLLIRKSDGGFNYAATDLATIRYRHEHFRAQRVVYVVDGRQQMHFRQLFDAARRWGYGDMTMEHVWFGTILGPDKKPIKTREGGDVKLKALLDEAEERAGNIVAEKRPELTGAERANLARIVGLGALKYADLAQNRNLDYVFNWDKLLAFDGNTAPYLQNAYVRVRAIFRKAGPETVRDIFGKVRALAELDLSRPALSLTEPAELELGRKLLDFGDSLSLAAGEYRPHYLCLYLFELATVFHKFYEACPVLTTEEVVRNSRLVLCDLTARTLAQGLNLLGIDAMDQM